MYVLYRSKCLFSYSVLFSVLLVARGTKAGIVISSSDAAQNVVDQTMVTSTLVGPNLTITDVNVIIDDFRTDYLPDYRFELTSPAGTNVPLISSSATGILSSLATMSRTDFVGTTFDDQASVNLLTEVADTTKSPYLGSFNIDHASVGVAPLTAFNAESAAGIWTLKITDEVQGDEARLNGWSIDFTGTAIPEPSSFTFLILTMTAAIGWKRLCCKR